MGLSRLGGQLLHAATAACPLKRLSYSTGPARTTACGPEMSVDNSGFFLQVHLIGISSINKPLNNARGASHGDLYLFGLHVRTRMNTIHAIKSALFLSLYSTLPMISFIVVPVMRLINGGSVLSVEEGIQFGIPELPPLLSLFNTILGFYTALIIGTLLFKTVITVGEVSLLIHLKKKTADTINDL